MEPLPRASPPVLTRAARLRAPIAAAAVVGVVFAQAPGRLVADTKLDLAVDPAGLMGRALHVWDAQSAFGGVPNQAVGYLFPMGPVFALGRALSVPAWVVQRAWLSLILVVALVGVVRLGRALGIGSETTRIVAGAAYALAPAAAALAGTSAHLLPAALLPFALIPLVRGAREGSERRAGARSGLAVAAMGGVNAATVVAVLPAPALFLLTRRRGARRRRLGAWWVLAVALATAWWVWALMFQARYGFDFLPFTESARVTTAATSATEVLRGGGSWLSFLNVNGPWAQGAWVTAALPAAVMASALVAAGGLAGLARRDCPERRFLTLTLFVGVAAMTAGYAGALGSPVAGPVRDLLDGPLAGLRNVGKAFPLVRLPLALGLAHVLAVVRLPRLERGVAALAVAAAVAATAAPFARGQLLPAGSFPSVPGHWEDVAAWLDEHSGGGRALVVPAAPFGEYAWGRPLDEPLQPLAGSPWAVRDLIPLGSAGEIRALDAVEGVLARGIGSPGLAEYLRRMGVHHVVVRNDLDWRRSEAPRPIQVRRVLDESTGIRRVARFGLPLAAFDAGYGSDAELRRLEAGLRAVEVYEVDGAPGPASSYPAGDAAVVAGGPEALLELAELGIVAGRAVTLAGDPEGLADAPGRAVVTDSLRHRDVDFGLVRRNASYVLAPGADSPDTGDEPREYPAPAGGRTALVETGGRPSASSYGTFLLRLPQYGPPAAFDGDRTTAWVSGAAGDYTGEWVQLGFDDPVTVREVVLTPLADGPWRPTVGEVEVTTAGGSIRSPLGDGEGPHAVPALAVPTRFVRVVLTRVAARSDPTSTAGAGLRDVEIPGVTYGRTLVPPPMPVSGAAQWFVFSSPVDRSTVLLGELGAEEAALRRRFEVARPARFRLAGEVVLRPGQWRDQFLATLEAVLKVRCGEGPPLVLDGRAVPTSLRGTRRDVAEYRPLRLEICGDGVVVGTGAHRLEQVAGSPFKVTRVTLAEPVVAGPAVPSRPTDVEAWGRVERRVRVGAGVATVLVVHENFNPGWQAGLGGAELTPVRVDGWQQGWLVPAGGAGVVTLRFAPDDLFRALLVLGALLAVALLPLALVPSRSGAVARPAAPPSWAKTAAGTGAGLASVAAAAMAGAGLAAAIGAGAHPGSGSGTFGAPAQALALSALAALAASATPPRLARWVRARVRRVDGM